MPSTGRPGYGFAIGMGTLKSAARRGGRHSLQPANMLTSKFAKTEPSNLPCVASKRTCEKAGILANAQAQFYEKPTRAQAQTRRRGEASPAPRLARRHQRQRLY